MRQCAEIRKTNETEITVNLNIDGSGVHKINTGIKFFDHMLEQLAHHSGFDLEVNVISHDKDNHHIVEDTAITIGTALSKALGDKKGITRYGEKILPMDEALVLCVVDLSGRVFSKVTAELRDEKTSDFETVILPHFFSSFAQAALMTIHIKMLDGYDTHHIIEAIFKSFARALKTAVSYDKNNLDKVPSTKGIL
ncbi:MAG: imidazoleglycerol-phosphate dehydratase HisB [Candidatus Gastranaerophilales bacterium]|nr:imidazoleglycerol-phosphate dehydratase HisB [Candidatus Gastranaerophilales bacterium]